MIVDRAGVRDGGGGQPVTPAAARVALRRRAATGLALQAGFSRITVDRSVRRGGIRCAVWYPTTARESTTIEGVRLLRVARDAMPARGRFPLVVVSHGTGGSLADHHGTAEHLARSGHVVLAITHPGDNEEDLSGVLGPEQFLGRCRHLSRAVDHVLGTHKYASIVDADRIAGLGCGVGAYTLLVLAGAEPDFRRLATAPELAGAGDAQPHWEALVARVPGEIEIPADERLRALILLGPTYSYLFDETALAGISMPTLLYDRLADEDTEPSVLSKSLTPDPERHSVVTALEKPFVAPCAPAFSADHPELAPGYQGFDRDAFHARLNADVTTFLQVALDDLDPGR